MDFFSTKTSTKFCNRFEGVQNLQKANYRGWAHTSGHERPGINSFLNPEGSKLQLSLLCPHTSPWITEDKSWRNRSTCHLFSWNWDMKKREGWCGQEAEHREGRCAEGEVLLPAVGLFTQGPLQKQNASKRVKVKSQHLSYCCKKGWKNLFIGFEQTVGEKTEALPLLPKTARTDSSTNG